MITGLDHIAIAVSDIEVAIKRFCDDLGLSLTHKEHVQSAQTITAFLPIEQSAIELIQPDAGQGPVQTFIDKRGGGLHHLCFRSDNIIEDRDRLKERGYQFIDDEPKPGAHNSLVLWIHPKCTEGVLIELAQHSAQPSVQP